jgi:hypothetical protein
MPSSEPYVDVPQLSCEQNCEMLMGIIAIEIAAPVMVITWKCHECETTYKRLCVIVAGACLVLSGDNRLDDHQESSGYAVRLIGGCGCGGDMEGNAQRTVVRVEASIRFLRIHFYCGTCRGTFSRFYDLTARGYVLVGGGHLDVRTARRRLPSWGQNRGQTEYRDEDGCMVWTAPSDMYPPGEERSAADLQSLATNPIGREF